jgi:hypothetical protein
MDGTGFEKHPMDVRKAAKRTRQHTRAFIAANLAAGFLLFSPHPWGAPPTPSPATQDLFTAVKANDLKRASEAIARGAEVNGPGKGGMTPLHLAAIRGEKEMAGLLVDRGARVNGKDDAGMTPLHIAAFVGRPGVGELLLARGADPKIQDASGYRALDYAVANRNQEVAALIEKAAKAPARTYTNEDLGDRGGAVDRGFSPDPATRSDGAPVPNPPPLPGSSSSAPGYPRPDSRPKTFEERRAAILNDPRNYVSVDRDEVRAKIEAEEKNFNPSGVSGGYQDSSGTWHVTRDPKVLEHNNQEHNRKLEELRRLEERGETLSEGAKEEIRQLEQERRDR